MLITCLFLLKSAALVVDNFLCGEMWGIKIIPIFTKIFLNKTMATFIGNIEAKLDAKGRVFVPAAYRKLLVCREKEQLVVRKDPDMNCLILYPENVWNKKVETLQANLDEWNFEDQMLLSQFVSDAEWLDMDSQGRILLNKKMLQLIQAESEVLFVGMLDRIAIWSSENYANAKYSSGDFAKRLSEKMRKTPSDE